MSKLYYVSQRIGHDQEDQLLAVFVGSPLMTLGHALQHFNTETLEQAKRMVSGVIPGVPECILERAKETVTRVTSPNQITTPFTVEQTPQGFNIWISDGPDKYSLVD